MSLLKTIPSSIDAEDQHQISLRCDRGEIGNLHFIMAELMPPWFYWCESLGVPSIKRISFNLQSQTAIDYILHDLKTKIESDFKYLTCRAFKRTNKNDYVIYKLNRTPILVSFGK